MDNFTGFYAYEVEMALRELLPVLDINGTAADYYEKIGGELSATVFSESQTNDIVTGYLNLGLWEIDRQMTYPEAATNLVTMLARKAQVGPGKKIFDASCGFGQQLVEFVKGFGADDLTAIDYTPSHVNYAQRIIVPQIPHVKVSVGSATDHESYQNTQYDLIISIEAAMHYQTKTDFFKVAFEHLKPGGVLAMTDMIPLSNFTEMTLSRTCRHHANVPDENMIDAIEYEQKLYQAGFSEVSIESIASNVYEGMYKCLTAQYFQQKPQQEVIVRLAERDIQEARGRKYWELVTGAGDYIVVIAKK